MRKLLVIGVGLLALCLGSSHAEAPVPAEKSAPVSPKWEYKVATREAITELGNMDFEAGLNKLGDEGWELISVPPLGPGLMVGGAGGAPGNGGVQPGGGRGRARGPDFIFKRSKAPTDGKTAPPKSDVKNEDLEVLKLKNVSAADFAKSVETLFVGKGGSLRLTFDSATNSVLVFGSAKQIEEVRRLMAMLDVPEAQDDSRAVAMNMLLPLRNAKVTDVIKLVQQIYGNDAKAFTITADERTNMMVLRGTRPQLEDIARVIKELDIAADKEAGPRKTP